VSWDVVIAPSARRDIKRLDPQVQARILEALEGLREATSDAKPNTEIPPGYPWVYS